jgi:hypothetical protein
LNLYDFFSNTKLGRAITGCIPQGNLALKDIFKIFIVETLFTYPL